MKKFNGIIIYETEEEFYTKCPECRFVAYLKDIPEASLHSYGATQEEAVTELRKLLDSQEFV